MLGHIALLLAIDIISIVDDNTSTTQAYFRGYETMSAWNVGTNAFPSTTQITGTGMLFQKNYSGTSANFPWWIIATSSFFYLFVAYNATIHLHHPPQY